MFSRSAVPRRAERAIRQACRSQSRGLAAPASGSFQYATGEAQGIKFAARDFQGPVTTAAIVSKAGTRYQPMPGLAEGLKWFAFKVSRRSVGMHPWGRYTKIVPRTPGDDRPCEYSANLNCSALPSNPTRAERTSWSAPSSFEMIYPTSSSCSPMLPARQNTSVCISMAIRKHNRP